MRLIQNSLLRAFAALGVVALAACASTDYHYSQLYGQRYYKTPLDTYPVTIVRVDGKDTSLRPVLVDPGLRRNDGGTPSQEVVSVAIEHIGDVTEVVRRRGAW